MDILVKALEKEEQTNKKKQETLGIDGGLGDLEEDNEMNEDMEDMDNSEESK